MRSNYRRSVFVAALTVAVWAAVGTAQSPNPFGIPSADKPTPKSAAAKPPKPAAAKPPRIAAQPAETPAPKPVVQPARVAGGSWRIQLGAFSQRSSAEALYRKLSGKAALAGRHAYYIPVGAVTRLQVGPFESKAAAAAACGALGQACFPVAGK